MVHLPRRSKACLRQQRRAASAVELAILLPMLSIMFLVALDFCRAYAYTQTIEAAAAAGALYASGNAQPVSGTSASDAAVQAAVNEGTSLNPPLTSGNVSVQVSGGVATVTVTYQFNTLFNISGIAQTTNVVRTVNMNVAPTPPNGW
jgi:Flp pilus assembly protein TadG